MALVPHWRRVLRRAWSVRIALLWGALSGLVCVWTAFEDALPLWAFAGLSMAMQGALAVARITHQPGIEE